MTIKFSDIVDDFQEIIFTGNIMLILTKSKQRIPLSYNIEENTSKIFDTNEIFKFLLLHYNDSLTTDFISENLMLFIKREIMHEWLDSFTLRSVCEYLKKYLGSELDKLINDLIYETLLNNDFSDVTQYNNSVFYHTKYNSKYIKKINKLISHYSLQSQKTVSCCKRTDKYCSFTIEITLGDQLYLLYSDRFNIKLFKHLKLCNYKLIFDKNTITLHIEKSLKGQIFTYDIVLIRICEDWVIDTYFNRNLFIDQFHNFLENPNNDNLEISGYYFYPKDNPECIKSSIWTHAYRHVNGRRLSYTEYPLILHLNNLVEYKIISDYYFENSNEDSVISILHFTYNNKKLRISFYYIDKE